jgi:hypothetical protein
MGRQRWTTEEQRTWLEAQIPEFLESQRTKVVGKFLKTTYLEWEKSWLTIPTQEELERAKGRKDRALAYKRKNLEKVRTQT